MKQTTQFIQSYPSIKEEPIIHKSISNTAIHTQKWQGNQLSNENVITQDNLNETQWTSINNGENIQIGSYKENFQVYFLLLYALGGMTLGRSISKLAS